MYLIGIGTNPIMLPSQVNGTAIPIIIKSSDEKYTGLLAMLSTNGFLAVLIICIPNRFETMLYVNHIVWNSAASLKLNLNHKNANTIKTKIL